MKRLISGCCRDGALLALFRQRRSATTSAGHSASTNLESRPSPTSAPIVTRLYSLQQYHRLQHTNAQQDKCKQLEQQAWSLLQDLEDAEVTSMPAKDIAELLCAWCYFSRHWAQGMDGPSPKGPDADEEMTEKEGDQKTEAESIWDEIPLVTRDDAEDGAHSSYMQRENVPPPRRPSPLDEILDF